MRTSIAPFRRSAIVSLCAAAVCATGLASSVTTVTASAGSNSCNQTDTTYASCNVSAPGNNNGPITAAASATALWQTGGVLDATTNANGPGSSGAAGVNFSSDLIVTGASGSGDLTISFFGFDDTNGGSPAGGTVTPVTISLDGVSRIISIPGSGTFSQTWDVNFGVFLPLTVSFSDAAVGTMYHDGTYGAGGAQEHLGSPTFAVSSLTGLPIPGTIVEFVPEPGTVGLLIFAVPAVWLACRRTRRAQA